MTDRVNLWYDKDQFRSPNHYTNASITHLGRYHLPFRHRNYGTGLFPTAHRAHRKSKHRKPSVGNVLPWYGFPRLCWNVWCYGFLAFFDEKKTGASCISTYRNVHNDDRALGSDFHCIRQAGEHDVPHFAVHHSGTRVRFGGLFVLWFTYFSISEFFRVFLFRIFALL